MYWRQKENNSIVNLKSISPIAWRECDSFNYSLGLMNDSGVCEGEIEKDDRALSTSSNFDQSM